MKKQKNNGKTSFSLIYSTCNEYSFLWNDYFDLLYKYWPEFNSEIISTASKKPTKYQNVQTSRTVFKSFSSRLISALKKCKNEIVLFTLDDFFLFDRVDNNRFEHALRIFENDDNVVCVNLNDHPDESQYIVGDYDNFFGIKNNDMRWAVTTQLSLWRKSYLLKILRRGESAWNFEMYARYRNEFYGGITLYRKNIYNSTFYYPYGGVFEKGHLRHSEEVLSLLNKEHIDYSKYMVANNPKKKVKRDTWIKKQYLRFYLKFSPRCRIIPFL